MRHVSMCQHARLRLLACVIPLALGQPASAQKLNAGPTLARLLARVRPTDTTSVAAFWDSVAAHGTPFIDPAGDDTAHVLASFVYRSSTIRNVVLENGVNGWTYAQNQLEPVPGTDIWHITVRVPSDIRLGYVFRENDNLIPWHAEPNQGERWKRNKPDPFNRRTDSLQNIRSVILGPRAVSDTWSIPRPGVPAGTVVASKIPSDQLSEDRAVSIYVPPATKTQGLPLLIVFDGPVYRTGIRLPIMLDNLIAAERVRAPVVVFVSQVNRMTELAPNEAFGTFVCRDVIGFMRQRYGAGLAAKETVVAGSSHGGLAATWVALRCPDRIGNVLAQSPSYWWSPPKDSEPENVTRQVVRLPHQPLRFWLEVGRFEVDRATGGAPGQVDVARHMRDVLTAKGYDLAYSEFSGGHEYQSWRVTMPRALEYLLPAQPKRR